MPSHTSIIRTLSQPTKPNPFQLTSTVPTVKNPFEYLLFLFQKCKDKGQLNQIHAHMTSTGLIHNPLTSSKLVASFALSPLPGTTRVARLIADQIHGFDTYTWNTIIRGYLEGNNPKEAILVYAHVRKKGLKVDSYTLLFATKACGLRPSILEGEEMHCHIIKMGFVSEIITVTSLLQLYGLFHNLVSAQKVFDETSQRDIVLWNVLVTLYAQKDNGHTALLIFRSMVSKNILPNGVTVVSVLSACSCLRALREGKQVHGYVVKKLVDLEVFVYNALIDMYSKCGCVFSAHQIFQKMPIRNVVSWTTMINGYSDNNYPNEALFLFKEMEPANVQPDEITILGVISACSKLGNSKLGEWVDHYVKMNGFMEGSVCVANALMDMHAKCGNIKNACEIFYQMEEKTVVSWTTMIQALAMHGHGVLALTRFSQMQREGFRPDCVVFLSILSACSHAGLVDEGRKCFQSMMVDHDIKPWMEHYGCMVDLLCRAGLVDEAFGFIETMPMNPDVIIWRTLLGACRNQGNISLASQIMNHLIDLEPEHSGNYILLSNLYATMCEWENVNVLRTEMGAKGVVRLGPGCSLIEVN